MLVVGGVFGEVKPSKRHLRLKEAKVNCGPIPSSQ